MSANVKIGATVFLASLMVSFPSCKVFRCIFHKDGNGSKAITKSSPKEAKKSKKKGVKQEPEVAGVTGPKLHVAIYKFEDNTTHSSPSMPALLQNFNALSPWAKKAQDKVEKALTSTNRFILIERGELDGILKEQAISYSDISNPATRNKLLISGIQGMIKGSVDVMFKDKGGYSPVFSKNTVSCTAKLQIKMIDMSTTEASYVIQGEGDAKSGSLRIWRIGKSENNRDELVDQALDRACEDLMRKLKDKLSEDKIIFYIAKVYKEHKLVRINGGKGNGLKKGDVFRVETLGEEILDPVNRTVIGREKGEVKGTIQVVEVDSKMSLCKVLKGSNFKKNDAVVFISRGSK